MSNKEMIVYKEKFISKIKKFFKNLFDNKKQKYNNIETISDKNVKETNKKEEEFLKEIRVDTDISDRVIKTKAFLEEIDGNLEMINMLSIDRLKKLEEYYDAEIKQNNAKINKLKSA